MIDESKDIEYMQQALALAEIAAQHDEVPVGALVIKDNQVIGRGWNQPIGLNDPSGHAEILALREAANKLSNYRLPGSTLYVTIEPCAMCIGAMVHARILRLVYGAPEPRSGAVASVIQLADLAAHNHKIKYKGNVLADDCAQLMQDFFRSKRSAERVE